MKDSKIDYLVKSRYFFEKLLVINSFVLFVSLFILGERVIIGYHAPLLLVELLDKAEHNL